MLVEAGYEVVDHPFDVEAVLIAFLGGHYEGVKFDTWNGHEVNRERHRGAARASPDAQHQLRQPEHLDHDQLGHLGDEIDRQQ